MYPKTLCISGGMLLAISNHAAASPKNVFRPPHNITFTAIPTTLTAYTLAPTPAVEIAKIAMPVEVEDAKTAPCKGGTIMCLSSGAAKQAGPPIEECSINSTNDTITIDSPEDIPYDISTFLASTGGEFPNLDWYSPSHLDPDGEPVPASDPPADLTTSNLLTMVPEPDQKTLHRCPHGEKSIRKPNTPPKSTNGCGTSDWMESILPGHKKFRECCNGHDICFGTCASDFDKCYLDFAKCMDDRCKHYNIFRKAWCHTERMAYLAAVTGNLARKAWRDCGEKRCECVKG